MSQEAAMFNDWASRMDAAYSPFNVYEDFKVAEEAKMIEDRRDDLMSYISDAHLGGKGGYADFFGC